jgi:ABC-type transport system involved in cytochrome c biogenesis permease subunit
MNPQITPLMPVLNSPILSSHVSIIMIAYALLAFLLFNGLYCLYLLWQAHRVGSASQIDDKKNHQLSQKIQQLTLLSRLLLYPAVFCLSIGIFLGAIWANVSWGNYWSWDPKETWALITFMVYAVVVHTQSLPVFRRPLAYHIYMVLAFLTILMTYFGVNYFLGGMHSYA